MQYKVFMYLLWLGWTMCLDTLYANDADIKYKAGMLVICSAGTAFLFTSDCMQTPYYYASASCSLPPGVPRKVRGKMTSSPLCKS